MGSKHVFAAFFCVVLILVFTGYGGYTVTAPAAKDSFDYASYRYVPGVTEKEIAAVEALRAERESFVYGIMQSTEAFLGVDGKINGFVAMFCEFLTGMFGIPFVPAYYEWDELIAGLESGEIDFTGELTPTEERRGIYLMTAPIVLRTVKVFRIEGSLPIQIVAQYRRPRYAFLDGVTTESEVRALSKYEYDAVFVDNYETAYELLKKGEADVFLEENSAEYAFEAYGDVVSEFFFPIIFSEISLTTQTRELSPIISVVQKMLKNGADTHLGKMYATGNKLYRKNKFLNSLTEEELAYLRGRATPVSLLAECDNYPSSFYNTKEKRWQGIAFDALQEIGELTGLKFEVINDPCTKWSDITDMLETGKGEMAAHLIRTRNREERFLWPMNSIMSDYYALLSRSDFRDINFNEIPYMKVGLTRGTAYEEVFKAWFPNHTNFVEFDGMDIMFEALERGEIDLAMASQSLLLFLTNYRELPGFKISLLFDVSFASTFGFHSGVSMLCGIVDKALRLVDAEDISNHWKHKVYDYRVKLAEERVPLVFGIVGLLLCVLALIFVLMLRNRSEGKRLEREVRARTLELEESRKNLEETAKAAEIASRVKSDFLAKMSHEIRTPMNAITGMAEIALREEMPAPVREQINTIKQASANLLSIINDILDLSKVESGKLEIIPVDYKFASLIKDVVGIVKTRIVKPSLKFIVDIDENIPGVLFGDEIRVRQILINVLSNAVKYTDEGTVQLSVSGKIVDDDTVTLTIDVTDTGRGIKDEDLDKLFSDFVQVDTASNKGIEGTGLGLAITKRLVNLMNGSVNVKSEYGKGSVFTIILPQKFIPQDAVTAADGDAEPVPSAFLAPEARILVVDDIQTNLEVAKGLMAPYKMRVDTCLSGAEAIEAVKANRYDLVFMDQMMPGMDGIEAAAHIRKIVRNDNDIRRMPIIALTANAVSGTREMFLQRDFNDYLSKPIDTAKLGAALEKWIPKEKQIPAEDSVEDINTDTAGIEIEGVDIKLGMKRTGGTVNGYLRTLEVFCEDGRKKVVQIRDNMDDISLYTTHVHALKSALGNIGADALSKSVKELEDAGKREDRAFISENTEKILAELESLLDRAGAVVDAKREAARDQQADFDKDALVPILTNLRNAIDDIAPSAISAFIKQLEFFENAPNENIREKIKIITQSVLSGDYDEAISAIDSALSTATAS